MLEGNILDVYPDSKKNVMVTWLTDRGRAVKVEEKFTTSFYVYAPIDNLYSLASSLRDIKGIENLNFTNKKIVLGENKKRLVLEVFPKNIGDISKISKIVDSWGGFHRYRLFNVDIRMPSRYLQNKNVFCNARVKWDGKEFKTKDSQWDTNYEKPSYTSVSLDFKRKRKERIMSFNDPIDSIKIGSQTINEENETDIIVKMIKELQSSDADIIYTNKGDSVFFPYLYYRAKLNNIEKALNFSRDKNHILRPTKQSKSYFSYGQIIYRPAFYTLKGRAHLDKYNSFMYGESGICGLIDISRCSNIPLQTLSRIGPGTAISQIQVNKAMEKGFLVPWKKNIPEGWKTAMELLISDRGGLILDPVVGIHEDVVELDFASLYPNVMLKYNISPETMLCSCCRGISNYIVPQLGYHTCMNQRGLLPEVLEPILFRRFLYKARSKNKNFDKELYKELQQAWKWVLLVCFGYTGYKNARYGRIECYESITAYSRSILLNAAEVVQNAGYEVIHGIIDSLWAKPKKTCISPSSLSRKISNKTGIRMELEGHYKWIVFLPSKGTGVGALNRYYGLFDNGEIKVRGIELRQRNSPIFLKNMQSDIFRVFSKAINSETFMRLIPEAIEVIKQYGKKIIKGEFKQKDLIFTTNISRDITEYKVENFTKAALFQLKKAGVSIEPGQSVRYVVCNEKTKNPMKRVCISEYLDENEKIDVDFYLRQIAKCAESILTPFDYTIEKLYDMLEKVKLREVYNVSVLPRARVVQTSL